MPERRKIPRLVSGVDLRALPLSPMEGFVLSRIDGTASVADLADLTNLEADEVERVVGRLIELDAVEWADGATALPRTSGRPAPRPGMSTPPGVRVPTAPRAEGSRPMPARPPMRGAPSPGMHMQGAKSGSSTSETFERAAPRVPSVPPPPVAPAPVAPPPVIAPVELEQERPSSTEIDLDALRSELEKAVAAEHAAAGAPPPIAQQPATPAPAAPLVVPPPAATPPAAPATPSPAGPAEARRPGGLIVPRPVVVPTPQAVGAGTRQGNGATPSAGRGVTEVQSTPRPQPAAETTAEGSRPGQRPRAHEAEASSAEQSRPGQQAAAPPKAPEPSAEGSRPRQPAQPVAPTASATPSAEPERVAPSAPAAGEQSAPPAAEPTAPEELELAPERRKKIDELYVLVDLLDHYQVLGCERRADKAEIRKKYFELSKVYHPDTLFRRKLGAYKQKMEVIFRRLTEAYDVLSKKKAREEYDRYLDSLGETQAVERTLSGEHELSLEDMAAIEGAAKIVGSAKVTVATPVPAAPAAQTGAASRPSSPPAPVSTSASTAGSPRPSTSSGSQPSPSASTAGSQPSPSASTAGSPRPSTSTSSGSQPSPSASTAGSPRPSTSGSQPSPSASTAGSQPSPSSAGAQRASASTAGSQPAPSRPSSSSAPAASSTLAGQRSEESKRRARELLAKKLEAATRSSGSRPRPPSASAPNPPPVAPGDSPTRTRQELLRDLTHSLRSTAEHTGGVDALTRHVREAQRAAENGDLGTAVRLYRLASNLAPERLDLKAEHESLARQLALAMADRYEQQAEYEEKTKKYASAAISWGKLIEARPDDVRALLHAAECLVEAKGDLHHARTFAQRAVELAPTSLDARRVLGRVYLAAGLQLNARRELERAAQIDPADKVIQSMLRELKG